MIIIPIKWLFHWEYTLFSDKPKFPNFGGCQTRAMDSQRNKTACHTGSGNAFGGLELAISWATSLQDGFRCSYQARCTRSRNHR